MKRTPVFAASAADGKPAREEYLIAPSTRGPLQLWIGWAPFALLPVICLAFHSKLIPWVFMWLIAGAIFAGCKWQTWWELRASGRARNWRRDAAYLLLWPGMDADQFFAPTGLGTDERPHEWLSAAAKTLAGAALIAASKNAFFGSHPLVAGWLGMAGIVLTLHFGAFYLLALAWKRAGIRAEPIMRRPITSKSVGEFWGKRWNLGFRRLSHDWVFQPLQKRYGAAAGAFGAFLVSGLIHELVISVPARAGYGLPTAYFLIQGAGAVAQRSRAGKRLRLGSGITGRIWTALVVVGPLPLLFHPWFVMRVVLPFLHAI